VQVGPGEELGKRHQEDRKMIAAGGSRGEGNGRAAVVDVEVAIGERRVDAMSDSSQAEIDADDLGGGPARWRGFP
jgi:hypothetical protein